jgi:hypothetical protein
MQDATDGILAKYAAGEFKAEDLDEAGAGDLQAARELNLLHAALSWWAANAENILAHPALYGSAKIHQKVMDSRNALLAVED